MRSIQGLGVKASNIYYFEAFKHLTGYLKLFASLMSLMLEHAWTCLNMLDYIMRITPSYGKTLIGDIFILMSLQFGILTAIGLVAYGLTCL